MLKKLAAGVLLTAALAGCGSQAAAPLTTPESVAHAAATFTPAGPAVEASASPSQVAATLTAQATRTARRSTATTIATRTRVPTATKSPTPVPTATPAISPTPTANAEGEIIHTVGAGETLKSIAAQYGVLWTQLAAHNNITGEVTVGQQIHIPVGMMSQTYVGGGGRAQATRIAATNSENRVVLGPLTFDWQRMNNCGPTTTSVMLSYYDISIPQLTIAGALKPNAADKNVSPSEIAAYVRGQGMGAFVGINGNTALLERLIGAGYPVIVEQWMQYDGGVGHYRLAMGYDRSSQEILQQDTFLGPDIWRSYADFTRDWAYFNGQYIVAFPTGDADFVASLVGGDWDRGTMWQRALNTFREGSGALSLYGQAEALHQLGNDAAAIPVYEQAIAAGLPARYFWYRFGYLEAMNNQGQYQKLITFTEPVLRAMGLSEDIRYHRAVAYRAMGQTESARRELTLALQDNPNYSPARSLLAQLPAAPAATATPTQAATVPVVPSATPTFVPPVEPTLTPELPTATPEIPPEPPTATPEIPPEPPTATPEIPPEPPTATPEIPPEPPTATPSP